MQYSKTGHSINWVMKYLCEMEDDQTLVMYSGHPLVLFPSSTGAPRVVVTNGMVIPNYPVKMITMDECIRS